METLCMNAIYNMAIVAENMNGLQGKSCMDY